MEKDITKYFKEKYIIDNTRIETEADAIIDFSEHNPFGEA